jgi:AraC-like DNA-binding protein/quercetin dioxygenase-like cupin family protein
MIPSESICQKSSLYLNEHVTRLNHAPAHFYVYYWGTKPHHRGNRPHAHTFFEICYVADGSGIYVHDGVTYPLHRGTLYCSKPNSSHYIESEAGMVLMFVAFDIVKMGSESDIVQMFERLNAFQHLFIADSEDSAPVLAWKALLAYCAGGTADSPHVAVRLAHSVLLTAVSIFAQHGGSVASGNQSDAIYSTPLNEAKHYIIHHLSDKLTLKDVANHVHLSERQMSRLLADQLGLTFPSWIRNERIKRAAYLLVYTNKTIDDISCEVGFDTMHYFSKVFGEIMNITPAKFRRSVNGNETDPHLLHRYLQTAVNRNPDA